MAVLTTKLVEDSGIVVYGPWIEPIFFVFAALLGPDFLFLDSFVRRLHGLLLLGFEVRLIGSTD